MERHQISITYNDPKTRKQLTRIYKCAPYETHSQALLSIYRALNFIYEDQIKFKINEREEDF